MLLVVAEAGHKLGVLQPVRALFQPGMVTDEAGDIAPFRSLQNGAFLELIVEHQRGHFVDKLGGVRFIAFGNISRNPIPEQAKLCRNRCLLRRAKLFDARVEPVQSTIVFQVVVEFASQANRPLAGWESFGACGLLQQELACRLEQRIGE